MNELPRRVFYGGKSFNGQGRFNDYDSNISKSNLKEGGKYVGNNKEGKSGGGDQAL